MNKSPIKGYKYSSSKRREARGERREPNTSIGIGIGIRVRIHTKSPEINHVQVQIYEGKECEDYGSLMHQSST